MEPGPVGDDLVQGMHRTVAGLAAAGFDVVVDHLPLDPRWVADLAHVLRGTTAFLVGVRFAPPVLLDREQARGDRTLGQALAQLPAVHAHGAYDLEVDTAVLGACACACAEAVMARLGSGAVPSALADLRSSTARLAARRSADER